MVGHFAITGIPGGNPDDLPQRRDIKAWYQEALDKKESEAALQVTLFILGLEAFQKTAFTGTDNDKTKLSYYRIASIHGLPLIPWDNVGPNQRGKGQRSFCAHARATFPTWHRPYLALYEQSIYNNMLNVIDSFKDNFKWHTEGEWRAAAKTWRLPYWDYATSPKIPAIAADAEITVKMPSGVYKVYDKKTPNPVWSYRVSLNGKATKFGDLGDLKLDGVYGEAYGTSRYFKTDDEFIQGISNSELVTKALGDHQWYDSKASGSIAENASRLMNTDYFDNWSAFASTRYQSSGSAQGWLSLEGLHNELHGFIGGPGQMHEPSVAAFDPIFWHHHCFIDMLFCTWQEVTKYAKWFDKPIDKDPSELSTTSLMPFYVDATTPYDSDKTIKCSKFGYTYDRTYVKVDGTLDGHAVRTSLRTMVNQQFSRTRTEVMDMLPADRKTDNDLIINVRYNKFGLQGGKPYWIHFFVGPVGEPKDYVSNLNRVGSVYNFSSPIETSGCENCKEQAEAGELLTGQVPITGAILKDWLNRDIADMPTDGAFDEAAIERYLAKNFEWRVASANGTPVSVESLPDLKVFVYLGDADHSPDDSVQSKFSGYDSLWGATAGKVGGGTQTDL